MRWRTLRLEMPPRRSMPLARGYNLGDQLRDDLVFIPVERVEGLLQVSENHALKRASVSGARQQLVADQRDDRARSVGGAILDLSRKYLVRRVHRQTHGRGS